MKVYADASVLVSLFVLDASTERAKGFLQGSAILLVLSNFSAVEFASAVARRVRIRSTTLDEARRAFVSFDLWMQRAAMLEEADAADFSSAAEYLRRLDANLRTGDALNIAIAQRVGAALATFDRKMADAARALGAELAPL